MKQHDRAGPGRRLRARAAICWPQTVTVGSRRGRLLVGGLLARLPAPVRAPATSERHGNTRAPTADLHER